MGFTYLPWKRQENRNGYLQRIKEVAAKRGIAGISDNDTRFDVLRMDSLDFTDLIMALEEEFGVTILPEEAAKMQDVGAMIDWLEEKDAGEYDLPA